MSKTEAKVQAVLAFGGRLKPVERQDPRPKKPDAALKPEGKKDGKRKNLGVTDTSPSKIVKRKRQANGVGESEQGRANEQKPPPKKRSIIGSQSKPIAQNATTTLTCKQSVDGAQAGKRSSNPVFARAAKQRPSNAVVPVDLTATIIPAERTKLWCPLSSALPPVHVLQDLETTGGGKSRPKAVTRNGYTNSPSNHDVASPPSASAFLGALLQREDHNWHACLRRQEIVDSGIASRTYHVHRDLSLPGQQAPATNGHQTHEAVRDHDVQPGSADMDSLRFLSYMHRLMKFAHHDRSEHCPVEERRWSEHLQDMQERGRRAVSEQLPWAHKYAPVAARRVLENEDASHELLMWLKQVEPIEAALTSMRSGQLTDSNAMSSWKADSDDSGFDQGYTRQCPGVGGMLISGPHGCGKSAAVYACAQELGIQVLEINPGMDRAGAMLLKLIGEATQSHRVRWGSGGQTDEATGGHSKFKVSRPPVKSTSVVWKGATKSAAKGLTTPAADQPVLPGASTVRPAAMADQNGGAHQAQRSMLLFEDFDQLLDRDEGFMASVATLLNKSKIAVILLSERPDAEAVLRGAATCASIKSVRMRAPSHTAVVEYLGLVCACEERYLPPVMLQRLAFACDGDLRSALQQLQFIASQDSAVRQTDVFLQPLTPEAMPMRLAHVHSPLPGEAAMLAGVPEGVANALHDCEWACAHLQHSTGPDTIPAAASLLHGCMDRGVLGDGCSAAPDPAGTPSLQSQCKQGGCAGNPSSTLHVAAATDTASRAAGLCADVALNPQAGGLQSGPDGGVANSDASLSFKGPGWMLAMRARQDFAAAAVLDKWAGVLQQRHQALQARLRRRTKYRAGETGPHCPAARGSPRVAVNVEGQCLGAPDTCGHSAPGPAEDVSHLEDDMASEDAMRIGQGTHAGASEEEVMVQLLRGGAGPALHTGSPGSAPAAISRQLADDSDGNAAAVATAGDGMQITTEDEAAVVAAAVDEMVTACEQAQVAATGCDVNVQRHARPGDPACAVPAVPPWGRQDIAQEGRCVAGSGAGPSGDAAVPSGGSIAAAAAAAGLQAAAAALGHDADAGVPAGTRAAGATVTVDAQPASRSDAVGHSVKGKRGRSRSQKVSGGEEGVPRRGRGRPPKDRAPRAPAHASRAAVVLQQGQESMLRHIDWVQRQAAELRSQCVPAVPHQGPEDVGGGNLGKENSVPGEAQRQAGAKELSWACLVSDVVSSADVFGRHAVDGCHAGNCGAAGEWLWAAEQLGEDSCPPCDAHPRAGSCRSHDKGFTAEQAEELAGGVCGALWDCCGTSAADGAIEFASPDYSFASRMAIMKSVRVGARDCSRRSLFDTWHALGSMSHDECAAAAALAHDGAAARRTRRRRGHCAEAVSVWDVGVEDLGAAALTWQVK